MLIKSNLKKILICFIWMAIGFVLACAMLLTHLHQSAVPTADCVVCHLPTSDNLFLVNVRSGDYQMIEIWQADIEQIEEAASWPVQLKFGDHYNMKFLSVASGIQDNHMGGAKLTIKKEQDTEGSPARLCDTHKLQVSAAYMLVDTKQTPYIAYPVIDGAAFEIRHYSVSISGVEETYQIGIESSLYAAEVRQWEADNRTE